MKNIGTGYHHRGFVHSYAWPGQVLENEGMKWNANHIICDKVTSLSNLKTNWNLRPVYNKYGACIMALLHLGLLASRVVNIIRIRLKVHDINSQLQEIIGPGKT